MMPPLLPRDLVRHLLYGAAGAAPKGLFPAAPEERGPAFAELYAAGTAGDQGLGEGSLLAGVGGTGLGQVVAVKEG